MHRRRKSYLLPLALLLAAALICCAQSFLGGAAAAVLKNHACLSITSYRGKICFAFQRGQTPDPRRWKLTFFQPLPQTIPPTTNPAVLPTNLILLHAANRSLLATAAASPSILGFHLTTQYPIPNTQFPIPSSLTALTLPAWFYILILAVLFAFAFRRYRQSSRPLRAAVRRVDLRIRRRAPWILAAFVLAAALFLETRRRPPAPGIVCDIIQPNLPRPSPAPNNSPDRALHTFPISALIEPRHSLSSTASRNARTQLLLGLAQTAVPGAAPSEIRATPAALTLRATPAQSAYLAALLQALQP